MRNVLICGVGPNLGKSLVSAFYGEGCNVYYLARDAANLISIKNYVLSSQNGKTGELYPISGDLSSDNVSLLINAIIDTGVKFDVVLFNASVSREGKPSELKISDIKEDLDSTLFGLMRVAGAVIPNGLSDSGVFLVVGSTASIKPSIKFSSLGVQKSAIRSLTLSYAKEFSSSSFDIIHYLVDSVISKDKGVNPQVVAMEIVNLCLDSGNKDIEYVKRAN
ncbi:MAG: SDR family oxidoreductase [Candidatus Paceibacterota bacterium]